jgi:hypothetical protein
MKTSTRLLTVLLSTAALGSLVCFAEDEPGVQRWNEDNRIKSFSDARKVVPGDLVTMKCKDCQGSVTVIGNYGDSEQKSRAAWHAIGAKQNCSECKGELTVAQGKKEDDMTINCSKCGEGTVTCMVATNEKSADPK